MEMYDKRQDIILMPDCVLGQELEDMLFSKIHKLWIHNQVLIRYKMYRYALRLYNLHPNQCGLQHVVRAFRHLSLRYFMRGMTVSLLSNIIRRNALSFTI